MEGIVFTSCILAIITIVGFVFALMVRLASALDGRPDQKPADEL